VPAWAISIGGVAAEPAAPAGSGFADPGGVVAAPPGLPAPGCAGVGIAEAPGAPVPGEPEPVAGIGAATLWPLESAPFGGLESPEHPRAIKQNSA